MDQHLPHRPHRRHDLRRAHGVPAEPVLRARRSAVAAWALEHRHPVDRDSLAIIVGLTGSTAATSPERCMTDHTNSRQGGSHPSGPERVLRTPPEGATWTVDRIDDLLWAGVTEWCRSRGVRFPPPERVISTLTTYLLYLSAHGCLQRGPATAAQLRRAVAAHRRQPVTNGRFADGRLTDGSRRTGGVRQGRRLERPANGDRCPDR